MKLIFTSRLICISILLLTTSTVYAQQNSVLIDLQKGWAKANYQIEGKAQVEEFERLIAKTDQAIESNPNNASIQIWAGIIKSTFAGVKGGLGALSFAKQARTHLQKSIELDDDALNGSAHTSLGTLYNKVPGWPVGFGDKKKAQKHLLRALEINPDGIDSNYFYADFLLAKKKYKEAEKYYGKAKMATPRADRPIADEGRRKEIDLALAKIAKRL